MGDSPTTTREPGEGLVEITRSNEDEVAHALVEGKFELEIDEPEWNPIGNDLAPNPANYLLVATAGCQIEVLAQAFHKARIDEYDIYIKARRTKVDSGDGGPEPYPEHTSWRHREITFELTVTTTEEYEKRVQRCLDVAENACIVSRSVENGIDFKMLKTLEVERSD